MPQTAVKTEIMERGRGFSPLIEISRIRKIHKYSVSLL